MTSPIPFHYAAAHDLFAKLHMQHTSTAHPRAVLLGQQIEGDWESVGLCGLADRYMQESLDPQHVSYRNGVLVVHEGEVLGHYKLGKYRTFLSWINKTNEHEFLLKEGGLYVPSTDLYEHPQESYSGWPAVHVTSLHLFPGRHARVKTCEALQKEKARLMQSCVYQKVIR